MAMATKSASTIAVFFVLIFLFMFEIPKIGAQDDECLKEYGGDVGFAFCAPRIFPTFCYTNCQANKGAKGGRCVWGEDSVKCLCDFCSDEVNDQFIRQV